MPNCAMKVIVQGVISIKDKILSPSSLATSVVVHISGEKMAGKVRKFSFTSRM